MPVGHRGRTPESQPPAPGKVGARQATGPSRTRSSPLSGARAADFPAFFRDVRRACLFLGMVVLLSSPVT